MDSTEFARNAILNTEKRLPEYFISCLQQRLVFGSSYDSDEFKGENAHMNLRWALLNAKWDEVKHEKVSGDCRCFVTTDIPGGRYGLIDVDDLNNDALFMTIDPKNTGKVSIVAAGQRLGKPVKETYLITGHEDDIDGDIMFTFHPGEPVLPSMLDVSELAVGIVLSKKEVLNLGFSKAKVDITGEIADKVSKIMCDGL